jgi:hypothetical protein
MKTLPIFSTVLLSSAILACGGPANAASRLFFEGDMVRGATRDGATGPTCVLTSQYKRLEHVTWRVRVLNPDGDALNDEGLESLVVELSDGQTFPMHFGKHPRGEDTDEFWATSWAIPEDYPTGRITYKVTATDLEGNAHEWMPFNVAPSDLTIIPGEVTFTK